MRRNLFRRLWEALNGEGDGRGLETRSERVGGGAGDGGGGAPPALPVEGNAQLDAELRRLDEQWSELMAERVERSIDDRLGELRSAITAELDAFRERLSHEERRGRELTDEWHEALAKFAKIGNRLAAQARRDLKKATDDLDAMPLGDEGSISMSMPGMQVSPLPPPANPEESREARKARLRRQLRA